MKKALRFLLIALLALAVPFQGALAVSVAVSAGPCVALGHHDGAAGDSLDHAQNPHCAPSVAISAAVRPLVPEARAASAVPASPPAFSGILLHELYRPPLAL